MKSAVQDASGIFIDDYEKAVSRLVLYALSELPFSLGMKRFINVLKGTTSTFAIDNELHKLSCFAVFSAFTSDYLKTIIEILKEQGLIEVNSISLYNQMPVLALTTKGKDFLNRDLELDVPFVVKGTANDIVKLTESEQQIFESLRVTRKELAKEYGVPAYVVCGDQVLRGLVVSKPKSLNEMLAISGIGERFIEKYGEVFLKSLEVIVE